MIYDQTSGDNYTLYNADCVHVASELPDESIGFSIHSPPFGDLFVYSDNAADMGNCANDDEFFEQYLHLVKEMFRVTKPGRLAAIHCTDLPTRKSREGYIGLKPFSDRIRQAYEDAGFYYHCRVTVWRDPVVEMQRTKALGLLYKQLKKDGAMSRVGLSDYVIVMRKPGDNLEPITHDPEKVPVDLWQQWASPVWMDIQQSNVLNVRMARESKDERHLCLARGSLVLTKANGYVPIQKVIVGDLVLTHKGRWKPVEVVQNTGQQDVITIKAQGVSGLTLTPDHKLWVRKSDKKRQREYAEKTEPKWIDACDTLSGYVNFKLPQEETPSNDDKKIWWVVGRWLADGHWGARDSVYISCGLHERDDLLKKLGEYGGSNHSTDSACQIRIRDSDGSLRDILRKCGVGAAGKHLPSEAFTLPKSISAELLDGYLTGDGHVVPSRDRYMASSVSRVLLLGISVLAQRVHGAVASVYAGRPARESKIQGRTVQCKQDWILSFDMPSDRYKKPFLMDDGSWRKVRSMEESGQIETWNLRVADDNSYTAEGCIVKNCPLQLDLIERAILLWSNEGDVVFSPFAGIGSEGYVAIQQRRKFIGAELKNSYFKQAVKYLDGVEAESANGTLFDQVGVKA